MAKGVIRNNGMNRTEKAYADLLTLKLQAGEIRWFAFEPMRFKLAANTFYVPDFAVLTKDDEIEIHEVKGFWRDDARVKIKVAAELFPFRFVAVKLDRKKWVYEQF